MSRSDVDLHNLLLCCPELQALVSSEGSLRRPGPDVVRSKEEKFLVRFAERLIQRREIDGQEIEAIEEGVGAMAHRYAQAHTLLQENRASTR